ncbi:CARDB domain-containing protein [Xanthomonas arboricola]|uniref:CARDB domain-containing protein n=1 Tax=Xanthomonas arboricola TaxID=56448 RepID=UPI0031B5890E
MVDRSTTALPMNDVVSGTLTGRAEVDSYTFTIDQPRYVHFDTLSGGTSTDLRWNLVDSYGQVFYNQTSTTSDTVGIWLAAGQYTLSLRTIGDLPRDYRFRLLDGSVTPEVQPGALVASSAPGDQIRLFHVQGIAGQNLYMVPSADYSIGSWALYGPTGNIVANSYYGFSTFPDIALTQTGQYTLVLQPSTNTPATVAMPFTIGVRQQTNTTAVLNSDIAGSVPSMGGSILYGFTIDSQQLVSFVGSAAKYGTLWSLVGPGGAVFSSRDFQNGAITQRLAAGNYTLAVQRQGLDTDDFSFRIVTAADRTALSTGTPIPATTDKPTTRAYSVDITDGNYAVALTTSGSASWTLYDRKGNTVASGWGNSTSTSLALAAGNYSLLVNSNGSVDQPITSTVTMLALTTVTRELLPGTPVHDRLDVPGQSTVYQFSIGAPDIVLIDALLASPGVQWTLTGPTGAIAGGWSLDLGSRSVLTLPAAGTYRLAISSSLGVAMPIGFNLRLFSALSPVTTDFAHPLDLATGAGSTVLRVDAGNRDALRLDANADFGLTATVYDMRGNNTGIQRSVGAGDTLSFTLPGEGTWFVLVTGNGNDTPLTGAPATVYIDHRLRGSAIVGQPVTGSTTSAAFPAEYTLDLATATRLVVRGGDASTQWKILLTDGTVVATGSGADALPVSLGSGHYLLEVATASPGTFSLDLVNLTLIAAQPGGGSQTGDLAADGLAVLRIMATQPLADLDLSLDADVAVTVYDGAGRIVFQGRGPIAGTAIARGVLAGTDRTVVLKGAPGIRYTLGSVERAATSVVVSTVVPLGDTLGGNLAHAQDVATYRLSVGYAQTLPLSELIRDAGSNGIHWRLSALDGSLVTDWNDSSSDASTAVLAAGEYQLTIVALTDNAHYSLTTLDSAVAPLVVLGSSQATIPADATTGVVRFDLPFARALDLAIIGDGVSSWQLYDGRGHLVVSGTGAGTLRTATLDSDLYTLVLERAAATASNLSVALRIDPIAPTAIAPTASLSGHLDRTGDLFVRTLTLGNDTILHIGGSGAVQARLVADGKAGAWTTLDALTGTASAFAAGTYELQLRATSDEADYTLALVEPYAAVALGASATVTLPAGGVAAFTLPVTGLENTRFHLIANGGQAHWMVLDGLNVVFEGYGDADLDLGALSVRTYALLIDGDASQIELGVSHAALATVVAGRNMAGTTDVSAQSEYLIHLAQSGWYYGVVPQGNADIELVDAYGNSTYLNGSLRQISAGDYVLRIRTQEPSSDYAFQLLSLADAKTADAGAVYTFDDTVSAAVYTLPSNTSIASASLVIDGDDANEIYWTVVHNGNIAAEGNGPFDFTRRTDGGDYQLIVTRQGLGGSVGYRLTIAPHVVPVQSLALGTTVSLDLNSNNGYEQAYAFTLDSARTVYLAFPDGMAYGTYDITDVAGTTWFAQDRYSSNNELTALGAGSYVIHFRDRNVSGQESPAADARASESDAGLPFRLDSLEAAPALAGGGTATVDSTNYGDVRYIRIDATTGTTLTLVQTSQASNLSWNVLDSTGNVVLWGYGTNAADVTLQRVGTYYLRIDGNTEGTPVTFSATTRFAAPAAPADVAISTDAAADIILAARGSAGLTFHLDHDDFVWLASTEQQYNLSWQLLTATGQPVLGGDQLSSYGSQVLRLPAGDYRLVMANSEDVARTFPLRVQTSASATRLAADAHSIGGEGLYALSVTAGQSWLMKPTFGGHVTLFRPGLAPIDFNGDNDNSGDPTLIAATANETWYFRVDAGGYIGDGLYFTDIPAAKLDGPDTIDYRGFGDFASRSFRVGVDGSWYVALDSVPADLRIHVSGAGIDRDFPLPSGGATGVLLTLPAGDYRIDFLSAYGGYRYASAFDVSFIDLHAATVLSSGQDVTVTLSPGVAGFARFEGRAGEVRKLGMPNDGMDWALMAPDGTLLAQFGGGAETLLPPLPADGMYFLRMVNISESRDPSDYTLQLSAPLAPTPLVALGDAMSVPPTGNDAFGAIYGFNLSHPSTLLLGTDSVGNGYGRWTLTSDTGVFLSSYWNQDGLLAPMDLPPGHYTLAFSNNGDNATDFKLYDVSSPVALTLDMPLQVVPGSGAPQVYALQTQTSGPFHIHFARSQPGSWALYDIHGNAVASGAIGDDTSLNLSGTYRLVFAGLTAGSDPIDVIVRRTANAPDLSVNAYQPTDLAFTVSAPTQILIDVTYANTSRAWSLLRNGQVVASGVFGQYSVGRGVVLGVTEGLYDLRLDGYGSLSLAVHSLGLSTMMPNSGRFSQEVYGGTATTYRFDAQAGQVVTISDGGDGASWRVYDAYGTLVADLGSGGTSGALPSTGHYYLVRDNNNYGWQTFDNEFSLTAASRPIALGTSIVASIPATGAALYDFDGSANQVLWLSTQEYFHARIELFDERGVLVYSRAPDNLPVQAILLPADGHYTLRLSAPNGDARRVTFRLDDISSAPAIASGVAVSGTFTPTTGALAWTIDVDASGSFLFDGRNSAYSLRFSLVSKAGDVIASGYATDSRGFYGLAAGEYYLVFDTAGQSNQANYQFTVSSNSQPLVPNVVTQGQLPTGAATVRYDIHADHDTTIVIDGLAGDTPVLWRLMGPQGEINSGYINYGDYNTDYAIAIPAGDYMLVLGSANGSAGKYSFRLLDATVATQLPVDSTAQIHIDQPRGIAMYDLDLVAGEAYFLDVLPGALMDQYADSMNWQLIDPTGRPVTGRYALGSVSSSYDNQGGRWQYRLDGTGIDLGVLTLGGHYTLIVERMGSDTHLAADATIRLIHVPQTPTVDLGTLLSEPTPDLTVNHVELSPATGLETGQTVQLSWVLENRGTLDTSGAWNDRVVVRNIATGEILLDITVPYDGSTGIARGGAITRQLMLHLPAGAAAAGTLSITVIADSDNLVKENKETNNSAVVNADVALAAHADISVSGLVLSPASGFVAGQQVAVDWVLANTGDRELSQPFSERVEIRNTSTGRVVATVTLRDLLAQGPIGAGETRSRHATFTWPSGVDAAGNFTIRVIADALGEIDEANPAGTGETNNTTSASVVAGPDLTVHNLTVVSTQVSAGGVVTLTWEDWNEGASPTAAAFMDRITIARADNGLVLVDTTLPYDPAAIVNGVANGPIGAGEHRLRSFTFRLPDGLKGAGNLSITVTSDQNTAGNGVLFEANLAGNAEDNNAASSSLVSAVTQYAHLQLSGVSTPSQATTGQPLTVSWTVSNTGQVPTAGAWTDQIILSRDGMADMVIGSVRHTGALANGQSYAQNLSVTMPVVANGRYTLRVRSDALGEVLLPDTRADTISASRSIDVTAAYADLGVSAVTVPASALSGENVKVTWLVTNTGNSPTDLALWNDRIVLARSPTPSVNDIVLAGSVVHTGVLGVNGSYTGTATVALPRDLVGTYYILVLTNLNNTVTELGRTGNNTAASAAMQITLAPVANLVASAVTGPSAVRPGDSASVAYTAANTGNGAVTGAWRDTVYLRAADGSLTQVASRFYTDGLAAGATASRAIDVSVPAWLAEGSYRWVVVTDSDNTVYERDNEVDNTAVATASVTVSRPDLSVASVSGPSLVQSGTSLHVEWTVANRGGLASGGWVDRVYLSRDGQLTQVAEVAHGTELAAGASYVASTDIAIPLDARGDYEVVVVTDARNVVDDRARADNTGREAFTVQLAPHADLVVGAVQARPR